MDVPQNKNIFFLLEKLEIWCGKYEAEACSLAWKEKIASLAEVKKSTHQQLWGVFCAKLPLGKIYICGVSP